MSLITASESAFAKVLGALRSVYGETDFVSPWMPFDWTDYYAPEMGSNLKRRIVAFCRLIAPDMLPSVKRQTHRMEQEHASQGKRVVNIDPGYVSGEHMILATTKAYGHRPYLSNGIYADLTLIYRKGSYEALEWTYPDYRQPKLVEMFNGIRKTYLSQLREMAEMNPQG
jgi:hypothetical protein